MPPQQAYGLLDLIDQRLDFSAHWLSVPSAFIVVFELRRTIFTGPRDVKS
jgi:hypothetical protein